MSHFPSMAATPPAEPPTKEKIEGRVTVPTATRTPSHRAPVLATIPVSYSMIVPDISTVITALLEID